MDYVATDHEIIDNKDSKSLKVLSKQVVTWTDTSAAPLAQLLAEAALNNLDAMFYMGKLRVIWWLNVTAATSDLHVIASNIIYQGEYQASAILFCFFKYLVDHATIRRLYPWFAGLFSGISRLHLSLGL